MYLCMYVYVFIYVYMYVYMCAHRLWPCCWWQISGPLNIDSAPNLALLNKFSKVDSIVVLHRNIGSELTFR